MGKKIFVMGSTITSVLKPIRKISIKKALPLLSSPDYSGLHKKMLITGEKINILAVFKDFYFVSDKDNIHGWVVKSGL